MSSELNSANNDLLENKDPQEFKIFENWDDLEVSPDLLRGIYEYGYEKPSPIQSKSINPIIQGVDLIAQAQSGTGKTASFVIGALNKIDISKNFPQVLIMANTHELVYQITKVVEGISSKMKGFKVQTIVGGTTIRDDINKIRENPPHMFVGCPGRVHDMIRRGHINPSKLTLVVLDEADEMLSPGFKDQVYNIFTYLNDDVQIALFSATLPEHIFKITEKFMRNPVKICVKAESLTLEGIKQYYVALNDDGDKYDTIKDLYQSFTLSQCIIYSNSVKRVEDLHEAMITDGFPVCCIHSNMDKHERDKVFEGFRNGGSRVLISTDITCRGIDVQQVSLVINFDLPNNIHSYLHRIGRTGRWGRKGISINFITRRDRNLMKSIETYYSTQIEELPSSFTLL